MFHVVDDDEVIRKILMAMFKSFGVEARVFGCPAEYIEHMNTAEYSSPTAIFSDVQMPKMNGYDFMYRVRQVDPGQKIVMITGMADIEHEKKNLATANPEVVDMLAKEIGAWYPLKTAKVLQ